MLANTSQTVTYTVVVDPAIVPGTYLNTASVLAANFPSVSSDASVEIRPGQVLGFEAHTETGGPSHGFAIAFYVFLLGIPAIVMGVATDIRRRRKMVKAASFRMYLL